MIQFTQEFCAGNKMLVLEENKASITVGILKNTDALPLARVKRIFDELCPGKNIQFVTMDTSELMLSISALETVSGSQNAKNKGYEISTIESGAPVVTVLNSILLDAKVKRASDVHVEKEKESVCIRYRIDGVLQFSRMFDSCMGKALSIRIKLMANLNTLETRKPQDGRFTVTVGGFDHDIRVSIVPSVDGESIVLRLLDTGNTDIRLEELGFSQYAYTILRTFPSLPHGLVLVTGPTGSGKTTTLAALIRNCDLAKRKIISVEDPVENRIPGITQIQTNENLGLSFSVLLRRILRQDPDVLMIGEIRDAETAELSIRAALTGHLVFATLHTRSSREAKTRLVDLGISEFLIDTVLCAVVNQRLVRKTCAMCRGTGCQSCNGSGYSGRIPIAEIFRPSDGVTKKRERTIQDDANECIREKRTSEEEISRVLGEAK